MSTQSAPMCAVIPTEITIFLRRAVIGLHGLCYDGHRTIIPVRRLKGISVELSGAGRDANEDGGCQAYPPADTPSENWDCHIYDGCRACSGCGQRFTSKVPLSLRL